MTVETTSASVASFPAGVSTSRVSAWPACIENLGSPTHVENVGTTAMQVCEPSDITNFGVDNYPLHKDSGKPSSCGEKLAKSPSISYKILRQ